MSELDGYERDEQYYRERMTELRSDIRHMDVNCASFCPESEGIRVAMVAELLKNALCHAVQETRYLLDGYVKPTMIVQIVEEAFGYARAETIERGAAGTDEGSSVRFNIAKEQLIRGLEDYVEYIGKKNHQAESGTADQEGEEGWLERQMREKHLKDIAEKIERSEQKPTLDDQKIDGDADGGREAR